jgi:hypothetical protein
MKRKIIIKAKGFDKEICSFLTQVGTDIYPLTGVGMPWPLSETPLLKPTTKWELPLRSMSAFKRYS